MWRAGYFVFDTCDDTVFPRCMLGIGLICKSFIFSGSSPQKQLLQTKHNHTSLLKNRIMTFFIASVDGRKCADVDGLKSRGF